MPDQANAFNAVRMFDLFLEFFDGGRRWTQGRYADDDGRRCLVGALNWICATTATPQLNRNNAEFYLLRVLTPARARELLPLIRFNDTRKNYGDLLRFLEKARALAQADAAQAAPPKRRRAKPPASTSMCTTALSHAEFALTER